MSQIIDSVFQADEECSHCSVDIEGKYLAGQGTLFMVNSRSRHYSVVSDGMSNSFRFNFNDSDSMSDHYDFEMIPEMMESIVAGVLPSVMNEDWQHVFESAHESSRDALRELRHERRDLKQEIRESEIEMIHMEKEDIERLETAIKQMEKQVALLANKQQKVQIKVRTDQEQYRIARAKQHPERNALRKSHEKQVQEMVLAAFCDYGSTLRSLSSKEKITIIFENTHREPRRDTVLVFNKDKITDCSQGKDSLRSQALTYQF
jgi:hypothetical protein